MSRPIISFELVNVRETNIIFVTAQVHCTICHDDIKFSLDKSLAISVVQKHLTSFTQAEKFVG